ncbi:MAG: hypothetical protein ACM65L_22695 [Microcoleus sp.]
MINPPFPTDKCDRPSSTVKFNEFLISRGVGAGLYHLSMGVKYVGEPFGYAQGIARPYSSGKILD